MNFIQRAVTLLGGFEATGRVVGRSGKAVWKWVSAGTLPGTEWAGETRYAAAIETPPHGAITATRLLGRTRGGR